MCGFNEMHIYDSVKSGCSFGLVVMPEKDVGARPATWDNFFAHIDEDPKYIEIKHIVQRHAMTLKQSKYRDLDKQFLACYEMSMEAARASGDSKMTAEKLAGLGD